MTTAECIKNIRIQLGQSQAEFAKLIDIDKSSVCLYESGKRKPSFATVRNIVAIAKKKGLKIKYTDVRDS